jgi:cyclase
MLKKRVIPVLFLKNGFIVRSEKFSIYQVLGNPFSQVDRYNKWNVDELIYIDITKDGDYSQAYRKDWGVKVPKNLLDIVKNISSKIFAPLTFGGNIKTFKQAQELFENGADKILINTVLFDNFELLDEIVSVYGSQAVVVGVDIDYIDGEYKIYNHKDKTYLDLDVANWIKKLQKGGAGEIFLNMVHKDGVANGYDENLIKLVAEVCEIPLIVCGGVGKYKDFKEGFDAGADAVAAGNIFNFQEMSYLLAKKELKKFDYQIR